MDVCEWPNNLILPKTPTFVNHRMAAGRGHHSPAPGTCQKVPVEPGCSFRKKAR